MSWFEGFEYLTTSEMRLTAVLRSERSRKSVVEGSTVGAEEGCHCDREVRVCCRLASFSSRSLSWVAVSLVGRARLRIVELSVLSSRWPI